MKKHCIIQFAAFGIICVGALLAFYPFLSNFLYENAQETVVMDYDDIVLRLENSAVAEEKCRAREYNDALKNGDVILTDPFDPEALRQKKNDEYNNLLNFRHDGVMGYVHIPSINQRLSIYHGTADEVLEKGVGHLPETSLPIGGAGTHTVLSAHSGSPGKKLFSDLELLKLGDLFYIHTLDEILAYQVDQINVVEPEDTRNLMIVPGQDYATLVTCTPYGVNSHRLLVRGIRTDYKEMPLSTEVKEGSQWMRQYSYVIFIGAGSILVMMILFRIIRKK
ncbi:class C sortase [Eubacterium maltosivorans]|uniref:Class C sortase n=1 Tax=Eubacterium maltosivorans TaxID=2041044 RepID=A0A4P9C9C4_EUBML|nr:class C sortase [Eubacterium maltosivorans]QCT71371.1 class C sortase [Eubacterium maltosivorans]